MNNFIIFAVGLVVTLITGMGVITGTVFIAYTNKLNSNITTDTNNTILEIQNETI
jgi:hypothetical protein